MRRIVFQLGLAVGFLAIVMFAAAPATAQKPSWVGGGKKGKVVQKARPNGQQRVKSVDRRQETRYQKKYHRQRSPAPYRRGDRHHRYFAGRDRSRIDRYYADQYRHGRCPPGLVKMGNRCVPRGQAKKWVRHRPLPRDVIFHDLPQEVLVQLGPPPPRHRFVRVAQDILLIAVGTGMVVDAIEDIGRIK